MIGLVLSRAPTGVYPRQEEPHRHYRPRFRPPVRRKIMLELTSWIYQKTWALVLNVEDWTLYREPNDVPSKPFSSSNTPNNANHTQTNWYTTTLNTMLHHIHRLVRGNQMRLGKSVMMSHFLYSLADITNIYLSVTTYRYQIAHADELQRLTPDLLETHRDNYSLEVNHSKPGRVDGNRHEN